MITINVSPTDITRMRFGFSPLLEAVISFHMLKNCCASPTFYLEWFEEAQRAIHNIELPYMHALISENAYIPDFLTPTPTSPGVDFDEELKRLRNTPPSIIQENVRKLMDFGCDSDLLRAILAYPHEAVTALSDELRIYWERTLAHHWSRMTAILENDILFRAREQALYGATEMLNSLHPRISYEDGVMYIKRQTENHRPTECYSGNYEHSVLGRSLQLVPVIFAYSRMYWQVSDEYQPMFIYGARGTGLWHYAEPDDPDEALAITLGAGRARVLTALKTPRSTSELAFLLDITSGAVSQHLNKLSQAGLVESSRSGKRVFYRLSKRGQHLIDLFG